MLFRFYINDLIADLKCNYVKLFADDVSLFTVVQDCTAANYMNRDLELISKWAHDWRMSFNPDPQKQAFEWIFSKRKAAVNHPVILFNDLPVMQEIKHKQLGLVLDSKLSLSIPISNQPYPKQGKVLAC